MWGIQTETEIRKHETGVIQLNENRLMSYFYVCIHFWMFLKA